MLESSRGVRPDWDLPGDGVRRVRRVSVGGKCGTLNNTELIKRYSLDKNRIVFVTDLVLDAPKRICVMYIETVNAVVGIISCIAV